MKWLERWDRGSQEYLDNINAQTQSTSNPQGRGDRFLWAYVGYKLGVLAVIVVLMVVALLVRVLTS